MAFRAIAIDGPAASGKSSVARRLAEDLGLTMVNSGAMYRAVTLEVLRRGIELSATEKVVQMLQQVAWSCVIRDGLTVMGIDGREPSMAELKSDEVNAAVSIVASIPQVRDLLVAKQREFLAIDDLVMEGRDIGTVVFPDTPFKFYITASEEVRAARRAAEGADDAVMLRDKMDSQRKTSPLKVADDAIVIDTSELTLDAVVEQMKLALKTRGWERACAC